MHIQIHFLCLQMHSCELLDCCHVPVEVVLPAMDSNSLYP